MRREVETALYEANYSQQEWAGGLPRRRFKAVGKVAELIAEHHDELLENLVRPNASRAEKLASEILPLADACRYAAKVGRQVFAPRSYSLLNGAWWMGRIAVSRRADPWGIVLILAPSNYPLLLPGVQIIQAIAAGNAVLVKPAPGCEAVLIALHKLLVQAGIPPKLVKVLPSSVESAEEVIRQGVDKVILTGSVQTGRAVQRQLAETLTPATMELSGCDAVFVLPQAKLEPVVDCLVYALRLNGGATCIAPRRVFVTRVHQDALKTQLVTELKASARKPVKLTPQVATRVQQAVEDALASGAEMLYGKLPSDSKGLTMQPIVLDKVTPQMEIARSDIFAPVISIMQVGDMAAAVEADRICPYSLGVSIFGPRSYAEHWAAQVEAGCVVINDVVVPTADPRVSFGGRDQSGWGLTRGREGLLEMTRPKIICTRLGNWKPHLDKKHSENDAMLVQLLKIFHSASWKARFAAVQELVRLVRLK